MNNNEIVMNSAKHFPGKAMVDFSVIITTYCRPNTLKLTLESLRKQNNVSGQIEVLVLDNDPLCSAEKAVHEWTHPADWVVKYISQKKKGKTYSMKVGVSESSYDTILALDDDIILEPNLLTSYTKAVLKWPNALSFGGPVICTCPEGVPTGYDIKGPHRLYLAWPHHDRGTSETVYPKNMNPMGSNRVIRRRAFELGIDWKTVFMEHGLFNSTEDDMSFGRRIHEMGGTMVYVPQAKVTHLVTKKAFSFKNLCRRYYSYGRYQFLSTDTGHDRIKKYKYSFRGIVSNFSKSIYCFLTGKSSGGRYHFFEVVREIGMAKELLKAIIFNNEPIS